MKSVAATVGYTLCSQVIRVAEECRLTATGWVKRAGTKRV